MLCLSLSSYSQTNSTASFPGAEGFGKFTSGGRGGKVFIVTTLNDSGIGSLREAVEAKGPRIIVFEVSGNIVLKSRLNVGEGNLTIAGQTAPGDGITLQNFPIYINGKNNIIIRFIRIRLGDLINEKNDALTIKGGSSNIIVDHCSFSWGTDETATFYGITNGTIQNCIISEGLQDPHNSLGSIAGGNGMSLYKNIWSHFRIRMPSLSSNDPSGIIDLRNNVMYNWDDGPTRDGWNCTANIIGNYYKPGPHSKAKGGSALLYFMRATVFDNDPNKLGKFYLEGNKLVGRPEIDKDQWLGVNLTSSLQTYFDNQKNKDSKGNLIPFPVSENIYSKTLTADIAYEEALLHAGASFKRDLIDERIVNEIKTGTYTFKGSKTGQLGIIDSQKDVGGWPELKSLPAPKDTDRDGMPDEWEIANGLNPNKSDDNLYSLSQEYTNIEVYINSLVAHIGNLGSSYIIKVSGISVDPKELGIESGKTQQIKAIISPSNATNKTVSWTSSKPEIATVNSNGMVTGISPGTALITAKTQDGSFSASSSISVVPPSSPLAIESFTLINAGNNTEVQTLGNGDKLKYEQVKNLNLNFRANPNTLQVGSVFISLKGPVNSSRTDNSFTFDLMNNTGLILPLGDYTLSAVPYSEQNRGGIKGIETTITFSIIESEKAIVPERPKLLSPLDKSKDLSSTINLQWQKIEDATFYRIQVSEKSDFSTVFLNQTNVENNQTQMKDLKIGTQYYWRVRASNEAGDSNWSETWSFTTAESGGSAFEQLAGHWKMDEGSGIVLVDHSGNSNNAIIQNPDGVTWSEGIIGLALDLPGGSGRYGIVPHSTSLEINGAITIAAWIRPNILQRGNVLFKGDGNGFELWLDNDGQIEFRLNRVNNGTNYRLRSSYNYAAAIGQWLHVAATFDGSVSRIFINGKEDSSASYAPFSIGTSSGELSIGSLGNIQRFRGSMDDLRLYRKALNGDEIFTLYDGKAPMPQKPLLLGPEDGISQVSFPDIQLLWQQAEFSLGYKVQISNHENFSTLIRDIDVGNRISFTATELLPETTYFWRVRSYNTKGESNWSETWRFTTKEKIKAPSSPLLLGPENMSIGLTGTITLKWSKSENAEVYRIQIAKDADFTRKQFDLYNIPTESFNINNLEAGTTFYWRVNASNEGGSSAFSESWKFETLKGPDTPNLISPNDNLSGLSTNVKLVWGNVVGADAYRLQVSKSRDFSQRIVDQSNVSVPNFNLEKLEEGTTYYWRVRAINKAGFSVYSEIWNFTTKISLAAPNAPELVSPIQSSILKATNVDFEWKQVNTTEKYQIQVSKFSNFSQAIVYNNANVTNPKISVPNLEPDQVYFWRVRAINAAGSSPYSAVWLFRTEALPKLNSPILISPSKNMGIDTTTVVFRWEAVNEAENYQLEVSKDSTFNVNPLQFHNLVKTDYTLVGLERGHKYYWKVTAMGKRPSSQSETWNFDIAEDKKILLARLAPVQIKTYPNPFNELLHVEFSKKIEGEMNISILNNNGITIFEALVNDIEESITLEIPQGWSKGMYILRIQGFGFLEGKKIIKN
jgi:fibronectin type 3 domain-containing protein